MGRKAHTKKKKVMFRGASTVTIDSKNRITMPTRYREELIADCEGKMVCTVDIQNPCLLLYPLPEWEEIELKLCSLSTMDPKERLLQQVLLGNASDCEMDKNGRILINGPLKQHAKLTKSVMLVGQLKKFEIWDEAAWSTHVQDGVSQIQTGELELNERILNLSL